MSANNNLTPTPVIDKNGVLTTRHKRAGTSSPGAAYIPAPYSPTEPSPDERLIRAIAKHFMPSLTRGRQQYLNKGEAQREEAVRTAFLLPEETRASILYLLENDDEDDTHNIVLNNALSQRTPEWFFNEYTAYSQHMSRDNYHLLLNSLRQYPQLPSMDDYSAVPENTRQQINALFDITKELIEESRYRIAVNRRVPDYKHGLPLVRTIGKVSINGFDKVAAIEGDDLVQLIMDHTDKTEQIKNIILDRSTGDADLIRDMITSSSPAISEGSL